jgi:RDD family
MRSRALTLPVRNADGWKVTANPGYVVAPLGRRSAAWLLDAVVGGLLAITFVKAAGGERDLRALWQLVAFKSVNGQVGHQLSTAMSPTSGHVAALKPIAGLLAIMAVIWLSSIAYRVVTTAKWGAGFGKTILGLQIVVDQSRASAGGSGEPAGAVSGVEVPGWARSWKRWAVPQAPGLIPLPATGLLAYLPAFRDARRRGLHDRAAGTVVIDVRARQPEPLAPTQCAMPELEPAMQDFYLTFR